MKAATDTEAAIAQQLSISIHAAREGGDETGGGFVAIELLFQSTPPVKAATKAIRGERIKNIFQSTPPVKAATLSRTI